MGALLYSSSAPCGRLSRERKGAQRCVHHSLRQRLRQNRCSCSEHAQLRYCRMRRRKLAVSDCPRPSSVRTWGGGGESAFSEPVGGGEGRGSSGSLTPAAYVLERRCSVSERDPAPCPIYTTRYPTRNVCETACPLDGVCEGTDSLRKPTV